jgi:rubrerythrin
MTAVSSEELWILSYYRESELAGSLLFGKLARRTNDDELRVFLTHHFAEEARHAWLWTETIRALGAMPQRVEQTYQSEYAREFGIPASMTEVLLLTERFETRIHSHFSLHLRRTRHERVRRTLDQMLREEEGHLGWIEARLTALSGDPAIEPLREQLAAIDERVYARVREREAPLWDFLQWNE